MKEGDRKGAGRRLLLVGNPNVGKSVLFGALTGKYATVSNYPGTTVEVARAGVVGPAGRRFDEAVDAPGANNLVPASEDEAVTRDMLLARAPGDVVVQVADAKNLARALILTVQLAELEVKQVLVLNMVDEARARGITTNTGRLSDALGVPVVETVAVQREGLEWLAESLDRASVARVAVRYHDAVEEGLAVVAGVLPAALAGRRGLGGMLVAGDGTLDAWVAKELPEAARDLVVAAHRDATARLATPVFTAMNAARLKAAGDTVRDVQGDEPGSSDVGPARPRSRVARGVFKVGSAAALAYLASALGDALFGLAGVDSGTASLVVFLVVAAAFLVAFLASRAFVARTIAFASRASMHPVYGLFFLAAVLFLMYRLVAGLGARTAVDFLQEDVFGRPLATRAFDVHRATAVPQVAPATDWLAETRPDGRPKTASDYLSSDIRVLIRTQPDGVGAIRIDVKLEKLASATGTVPSGVPAWEPVDDGSFSVYEADERGDFGDVERIDKGHYRVRHSFAGETTTARIEVRLWRGAINRFVYGAVHKIPSQFVRDLIVGPYGVVTMALTYAIALILPIIATFFLAFSFLEDSGYLPRLAVMVNDLFRALGLNGKAVLPMILGLGCDTMATTTTRILETRKERILVTLLLALAIPCSAQLGVILAMLSTLSFGAAIWWFATMVVVLLVVGYLGSRVIPGRSSDLILELPPLRRPQLSNIVVKTVGRIEWYLKEAVPLFVVATLLLFVLDRLDVLSALTRALEPVVVGFLGLPADAAEAFLIGFLRRDFGATKLFDMSHREALGSIQVVVAITTITLFVPCVANVLMIIKERGGRVAAAMIAFIFPLAFLVGGALNWVMPRGEPAGKIPVAVTADASEARLTIGPLFDAERNRLADEAVRVRYRGGSHEVALKNGRASWTVPRDGRGTEKVDVESVRGSARSTFEISYTGRDDASRGTR